jgi:transcriptional regulator with XRE-family HTH domain
MKETLSQVETDGTGLLLARGLAMAMASVGGLTRQQVARAAGISSTHVTKVLPGTSNPSQKVVVDLARAVGFTVSEIYKLGEFALERQRQRENEHARRLALEERSVESIVRVARTLDRASLSQLIEALEEVLAEDGTKEAARCENRSSEAPCF